MNRAAPLHQRGETDQLIRCQACTIDWHGTERAHCCRRTGGCGHVFDTAELWDEHRLLRGRGCLSPTDLGLLRSTDGVWVHPLALCPPD